MAWEQITAAEISMSLNESSALSLQGCRSKSMTCPVRFWSSSAATTDGDAQKLGNNVWHDSELIANKDWQKRLCQGRFQVAVENSGTSCISCKVTEKAWSLFFLEFLKILKISGPRWGFFNPNQTDPFTARAVYWILNIGHFVARVDVKFSCQNRYLSILLLFQNYLNFS